MYNKYVAFGRYAVSKFEKFDISYASPSNKTSPNTAGRIDKEYRFKKSYLFSNGTIAEFQEGVRAKVKYREKIRTFPRGGQQREMQKGR